MSFSTEIKKEIVNRISANKEKGVNTAGFSAFVRTSGTLGVADGKPTFFLVSETETVAEYFTNVFSELFKAELTLTRASMDRMSGRDKLVLLCPPDISYSVLKTLGLLKKGTQEIREGILPSLIKTEACQIAYIQGAFLGSGSCILPKNGTGYHLEIVFDEKQTARDFCKLLNEYEVIARLIRRKETQVVYIKSKEAISDFLSIVGTDNALKKFNARVEERDEANNDNRAKNCMAGNADKTVIASVKQVVAIRKLHEKADFNQMSEELKILARARLQFPTMSLRELAEYLGISKSCLNHRIRKLLKLAEEL
ncbi:MAG: DNA-binding protein WhiA [Clostridiales bacterium]|nr:DNA-binding protein WhiA [Clostridiales bacterium]